MKICELISPAEQSSWGTNPKLDFLGHSRYKPGWGVTSVEHHGGDFILGRALTALKGVIQNYLLANYSLILLQSFLNYHILQACWQVFKFDNFFKADNFKAENCKADNFLTLAIF